VVVLHSERRASQAVLVGDPMQLPATVLSSKAQRHHLAQSLFERLQRVRTTAAYPP
jgi:superfamily I DNA and/or RNA helicase